VTGERVHRASFARAFYKKLDYWYNLFLLEGGRPIHRAWLKACIHHGEILELDTTTGTEKGWFAGLDEEGCLLLKTGEGDIERIHAGDVIRSVPRSSKSCL
jgi:BirA family biotin operon repressor/biotin-[acetyl-CoA-carboxylase] ligase